jgi:hypothetical protein
MWDTVSQAELAQVRQQLDRRREDMLRRHAEELEALDIDRAELETIDQLLGNFVKKFRNSALGEAAGKSGNVEDAGDVENADGVSLLITQAQRAALREMGHQEDEIRNMKPDEAHRILGVQRERRREPATERTRWLRRRG